MRTQEEVKEYCIEQSVEECMLFEDYDYCTAFVGLSNDYRAIYDYDRMVEYLVEKEDFTAEDAIEWIDYNTIRALDYISDPHKPIILFTEPDTYIDTFKVPDGVA